MKKINRKIFNLALWIELVAAYVLPFKVVDNFQYKAGFPIPFISVYDTPIGVNPLMSMHLNPLSLFANAVIIYFILVFAAKFLQKIKASPTNEQRE